MSEWALQESALFKGRRCLFSGLDSKLEVHATGQGCLLSANFGSAQFRHTLSLGQPRRLRRFVACHREEPFWMNVRHGRRVREFPIETQYALLQLADGSYLLLVPLADAPYRAALAARGDTLQLILDTADPELHGERARCLYLAHGADPHLLCERGALELRRELCVPSPLAHELVAPAFVEQFGWCTWDAFQREVSHDTCLAGLRSFGAGTVRPRWVVLDDGWQDVGSVLETAQLCSFEANAKFPQGLGHTVSVAKREYGVETFMVWHAVHGYWAGLDEVAFARYSPTRQLRWYSPEILTRRPYMNLEHAGPQTSRPTAEGLTRLYADYHAELAALGVDGVKVDNQASIEAVARGEGGRVASRVATQRALSQSAHHHFRGNLLNCMSCSNDAFYTSPGRPVTRTSGDYLPHVPDSHGAHLLVNAHVGTWFGKFVLADWDMFQSAHPFGPYHAAARAISGGPVYVSDPPGKHDLGLLQRLVLSDGSTPRALDSACPTRDSLFVGPSRPDAVLKIYNRNATSFVVGAFSLQAGSSPAQQPFSLGPSDVPQIERAANGAYAVYLVEARRLLHLSTRERTLAALGPQRFEIAVVAPVMEGLAALGLVDQLNPGGCIHETSRPLQAALRARFRDGGRALFYCARAPHSVFVDGLDSTHRAQYDPMTRSLFVDLARGSEHEIEVRLEAATGS